MKDDSHEAISVELTMRSDESSEIASAMTTPTQPLRVLYMDDDEMALTMTQLQLMRAGIHMEATSDALEAVSIMTTQELDIILLDSVMPTIDGVEFLQLMRSLQLAHPVVFLTGHGVEELREATREFEVLGVLDKQADRLSLPERLRELHAAYLSGNITMDPASGEHRAAS